MAKTRRSNRARPSARKPASRKATAAHKRSAGRSTSRKKPVKKSVTAPRSRKSAQRPSRQPSRPKPKPQSKVAAPPVAPEPPPPPPRKPTYHEAVSLYERGLQALQRRDFAAAAEALRNVIARYPDERELLERARLYLKVCERELEPREPAPRTADEWVYAATVALNSADEPAALHHLTRALEANPRHDHAHYMMAVTSARRGDRDRAIQHLRHAVSLNPENRNLARQDPDLEGLRDTPGYREALEAAPASQPPVMADKSRKGRR